MMQIVHRFMPVLYSRIENAKILESKRYKYEDLASRQPSNLQRILLKPLIIRADDNNSSPPDSVTLRFQKSEDC